MKQYSVIKLLILCAVSTYGYSDNIEKKEHEIWWENSLDKSVSLETFRNWLGGIDSLSRQQLRDQIQKYNYSSMLDAACGLCIDYWGLRINNIDILYQGLDITPKLVKLGKKNNIPIQLGSIEMIPFDNNSFDLVYGRHILEHLPSYETALTEMVRVAIKEVLITFFIPPTTNPTRIESESYLGAQKDTSGFKVYSNHYNVSDLENYLLKHAKVHRLDWDLSGIEPILHIYLNSLN